MATPDEYLAKAAEYIGVSGTDNIFNTWYWGYHCYDPDDYPWCACYQSYVGVHDLEMPFRASASAAGVANQGRRIPDSEARAGDWVVYNWGGSQSFDSYVDHIGVVEWSDINGSGLFGTLEGNTGSAYGGEVARMTRNNNSYYGTAFFRPPYAEKHEPDPEQVPGSAANNAGLWYRAHVQNLGWCDWVHDGQVAGTTGFGLRLEALQINPPEGWELEVVAHIQNEGWKMYVGIVHGNDVVIGTVGKALRIEMLGIRVVKSPAGSKNLRFRMHQQNVGWKNWTGSGFASGTDGQSQRLEAAQIQIG